MQIVNYTRHYDAPRPQPPSWSHALRPIAVLGTRCHNRHMGGNSSTPPGV